MIGMQVRIATRNSPLALAQAETVAALLRDHGGEVELVPVTTRGDADRSTPLASMGSAGVFTKALEDALFEGRADVAVHSAKDMPTSIDPRFELAAFPRRDDPRDALVGSDLDDLAPGALVSTGSPRRRAQLAAFRPDLTFQGLRGNIETRVRALASCDAVVVGAVALDRLGLAGELVVDRIDPSIMLPAQGQGAIAVEAVAGSKCSTLVREIDDLAVRSAVVAERACVNAIGGGCSAPVGAHASIHEGRLLLRATVHSPDGHQVIAGEREVADPLADGAALGEDLLRRGAGQLMNELAGDSGG